MASPYTEFSLSSNQLLEDATELVKHLKRIREEVQEHNDYKQLISEINPIVAVELCRFVKLFIPNIGQKIDEIIKAEELNVKRQQGTKRISQEYTEAPTTFFVSPKQHGADLVELNNSNGKKQSHLEIKASTVTEKKWKCDFMWNVPSGSSVDEQREKLIKSVTEKTRNGRAIYRILDGRTNVIKEYEFESEFLVEYFKHINITDKTTKYNMGCERCKKCGSFHRLDKIEKFQKTFLRQAKTLSKEQITELFEITRSQC